MHSDPSDQDGAPAPVCLIDFETGPRGGTTYTPHIGRIYRWFAGAGYGVHRPAPGVVDVYRQRSDAPVVEPATPFDLARALDVELFDNPPHGLDADEACEIINRYGRAKLLATANFSLLPEIALPAHRHTRHTAAFHYESGTVTLTAHQHVRVTPLAQLTHTVRAEHLIKRAFVSVPDLCVPDGAPGWRGRCYGDFMVLVSSDLDETGAATVNHAKYKYLQQLMGYLLHDHRRKGDTDFCVILCDSEAGGTGKGLLIQAIEKLTSVVKLDARNDRPDFSPLDLSTATRVKVYNDITKTFNFAGVYNEITDGGSIRHMHRPPIGLSYHETWKVLITSNFPIRGADESDRRRQRVFDMTLFFNAENRVSQVFKHSFFDDWDADDWNIFDNLMLQCVQAWLDCDYQINAVESAEYKARQIAAEYPQLLREYLDSIREGWHPTGDLYRAFIARPDVQGNKFCRDMSATRFGDRALTYYRDMGRNPLKNPGRTRLYVGPKPSAPADLLPTSLLPV